MSTTTNANRLHIDFAAKRIVGSKASFDKAGKGLGPIYDELARLMKLHPDFGFEVRQSQQRSAKPKQTYKGLDIDFIRDFLAANEDEATLKVVDDVITFAKQTKAHSYPLVKRVFFEVYDCFDYADAKQKVADYRAAVMLAKAEAMAAKIAAVKAKVNGNELAEAV